MRISASMQRALNEQIQKEFGASYLYLSMAAYFAEKNLNGFARWMRLQANEELEHAMRLFEYVNQRGGRVLLQAVGKPPSDFGRPRDAFGKALEHEQAVTASIHRLYALADQHSDLATMRALDWFVTEQVEEESNFSLIIRKLKRVEGDGRGLLMVDQELGQRTFVPPAAVGV